MSTINQAYSEAISRLPLWLQFLDRKAAEYQTQMNRVKRGQQPAPDTLSELTLTPAPDAEANKEDTWL